MEKGFLKKNKILVINLLYVLSIIPIIIFGYYKNGYLVWKNGYMDFFHSTQYLVIPIIIILLSYIFETYYYMIIKKEDSLSNVVNSIVPYINALCYLVCAPSDKLYITIPIIVVLDIALKFINDKFSINQVALFKCILYGALTVFGSVEYANAYEITLESVVNEASALFIGNGIGEIGTTSVLCALVGYIILLFNKYYKRDIPIYCVIGYSLFALILCLIGNIEFSDILFYTFGSGFMFFAIFVTSLSNATPVIKGGRIVYGLIAGIISAVFVLKLHFNIGMYITILVLSLLNPLFNKIKISFE